MQPDVKTPQEMINRLCDLACEIRISPTEEKDKNIGFVEMSFNKKDIDLLNLEEYDLDVLLHEHVVVKDTTVQVAGYNFLNTIDKDGLFHITLRTWTPVRLMRGLVQVSKFIDFHINGDIEFIVNVNDHISKIFRGDSLHSFVGECFLFRSEMNQKTIAVTKVDVDVSKIEKYREMRILMTNTDVPNLKVDDSNTFFIENDNYRLL